MVILAQSQEWDIPPSCLAEPIGIHLPHVPHANQADRKIVHLSSHLEGRLAEFKKLKMNIEAMKFCSPLANPLFHSWPSSIH
jgi:hypothetical protein